jgi:acyl-CoA thioesterase-2
MSSAVDQLIAILDLEPLERNLFRGRSPRDARGRVFGGQVIAQALVACSRTVDGRDPHSLHAYFLLGGDPEIPILYEVDRIRDGGSFTTRRVLAIQNGAAIFAMTASFHKSERGHDHQLPMPDVPRPDALPSEAEMKGAAPAALPEPLRLYLARERPIELRPVEFERYLGKRPPGDRFHVWFRAKARLPDEPATHRAVLAFASDLTLLDASLVPHGMTVFQREIQAASLDHALWFHRRFRADEWLLYAQDSPSAQGARGFSRGLIYTAAGTLVASVAQEGLIRPARDRG